MNLMQHLPVLIIVIPMSAALLCTFFSMINMKLGKGLVVLALSASFVCSLLLLFRVLASQDQTIHYAVGRWEAPIGIEFVVDPINAVIVCFITFIAACTSIYSIAFIRGKRWLQSGGYYALIGLLTIGLCGMTLTGDVFNLYVFLEISSLSCYGLVAMGGKRSVLAAFRYLLIGTIGASFYLVGIGILYSMTGSLNMADIGAILHNGVNDPLMILACASLVSAFGIKMAIFPFHMWQPDAYSYAYPAASPLISGAMSKVPALAMIRFFFFILGGTTWVVDDMTKIIGVLGALSMIFGSMMALAQVDFRRMLAYSSIAQLGYVALGIGIGNAYGLSGSVLHILNHIFMKGGLFFAIGAIQYRLGIVDIRQFGQLHKKMPLTCFTIVIGALAMVGIPPTGGFFSKWYLMLGANEQHQYVYLIVLIISSLLNAIYFLRVLEKIFISPPAKSVVDHKKEGSILEAPPTMLIPVVIFGIGMIAMGVMNGQLVQIIKVTLQGVL